MVTKHRVAVNEDLMLYKVESYNILMALTFSLLTTSPEPLPGAG